MSITLASLVALVLTLPFAALSDRIGRRPMLIAGSAGFVVFAYPLFLLVNSGSLVAAITAHCILAAIEAVYISAAVTAGVELFATRVRYSGFSIGYNIAVAGFGGTTPYVVTWLTARTGNVMVPAFYLIAAAAVSSRRCWCCARRRARRCRQRPSARPHFRRRKLSLRAIGVDGVVSRRLPRIRETSTYAPTQLVSA